MSARAGIQVTSLEELLPAAESTWSRELALVEAAPPAITIARAFRGGRKQDEPQGERLHDTAAVPPYC